MIFFSVIIPTYNRAHLITETIDSILDQTYPYFEILIIDDGSTDNTKQIIESGYSNEKKIIYFYKQNEERGAARNFGLKQAKGDYTVFLDSDDLMLSPYLETLDKIITENPGVKLLATKYNYFSNGKTITHPELQHLTEGWYDRSIFLKGNILACNYCINIKDKSFSFFQEERELASTEDWLFLLANLKNNKIFISKEVCLSMRQHDKRSMNNNQKVIEARKKATEWVIKNLNLSESEKKILKAWSHYFCAIHQYLDHNRSASLKEITAAIKGFGLNKEFLLLFIKAIVGRKMIKLIK
ncbi:MAG TPA: glycosyltransferase family A protein [Chitinophagaceae bacterium]|nr:glycosyltransferase family A protein [Chitinophagaceae bacterium]